MSQELGARRGRHALPILFIGGLVVTISSGSLGFWRSSYRRPHLRGAICPHEMINPAPGCSLIIIGNRPHLGWSVLRGSLMLEGSFCPLS
jgi:hypothetical protein